MLTALCAAAAAAVAINGNVKNTRASIMGSSSSGGSRRIRKKYYAKEEGHCLSPDTANAAAAAVVLVLSQVAHLNLHEKFMRAHEIEVFMLELAKEMKIEKGRRMEFFFCVYKQQQQQASSRNYETNLNFAQNRSEQRMHVYFKTAMRCCLSSPILVLR
jgi:hypothetical protein